MNEHTVCVRANSQIFRWFRWWTHKPVVLKYIFSEVARWRLLSASFSLSLSLTCVANFQTGAVTDFAAVLHHKIPADKIKWSKSRCQKYNAITTTNRIAQTTIESSPNRIGTHTHTHDSRFWGQAAMAGASVSARPKHIHARTNTEREVQSGDWFLFFFCQVPLHFRQSSKMQRECKVLNAKV